MEASHKAHETTRRRRYERCAKALPTLTPNHLRLLGYVAEFGLLSLVQVARVDEISDRAARRFMRALYDAGLVEVVPVCRAAVADGELAGTSAVYGSAPNLYRLTKPGMKLVIDQGLRDACRPSPEVGPLAVGLRHFLATSEVRIWLERTARHYQGHRMLRWANEHEAAVDFGRLGRLRPDAWFVYGIDSTVLVGFVEVDRSTERGQLRWKQKAEAYTTLFSSGRLRDVTGYYNARILVVAPNATRRDWLSVLLAGILARNVWPRFWITDKSALTIPGFSTPCWRRPGEEGLRALIP